MRQSPVSVSLPPLLWPNVAYVTPGASSLLLSLGESRHALGRYRVDWFAHLMALVGVVIGIGGTAWTERFRWRRTLDQQAVAQRRDIYVQFLNGLNAGQSAMQSATWLEDVPPDDEWRARIFAAFVARDVY